MGMDDANELEVLVAEEPEVMTEVANDIVSGRQGTGEATLTVIRSGVLTDDVYRFVPPATVGRFDPTIGPIDVDLGNTPEGNYVSRKHAQIICDDGVWKLRDLGSSNGSFILREDFEKIEEAEIVDGDTIAFGNARFKFNLVSEEAPDTSA